MCGGNRLHRKSWLIFQWLESIFTLLGLALYDISTKQIKISLKEPGKAFGKLLQSEWPTSYFVDNFLCYISERHGLEPTDLSGTLIPQPGGKAVLEEVPHNRCCHCFCCSLEFPGLWSETFCFFFLPLKPSLKETSSLYKYLGLQHF